MAIDIRNPRVQKLALIGVLLGCVMYVYFFTDWMPFTYKANATELAGLEDQYRELSKDLNKGPARRWIDCPISKRSTNSCTRSGSKAGFSFQKRRDIIGLLRTITVLGTNAGVDFTKFRPQPPVPADGYTEIPIEITVMGGLPPDRNLPGRALEHDSYRQRSSA